MINKSVLVGVSLVFPFVSARAGETIPEPLNVNYCEVVTLPQDYDGKVLSVDVVLVPDEHSLSLFGANCLRLGYDRVTEAQLPNNWTTLPNGEALKGILRRHLSARVKLIGTFDSSKERYGPDGARFQFSISSLLSAQGKRVGRSAVVRVGRDGTRISGVNNRRDVGVISITTMRFSNCRNPKGLLLAVWDT